MQSALEVCACCRVGPLLPQVNSFVTKEHPPRFRKNVVEVSYIWLPSHSLRGSHNFFIAVMPAIVGPAAVWLSTNGSVGSDKEGPHLVVNELEKGCLRPARRMAIKYKDLWSMVMSQIGDEVFYIVVKDLLAH